MIKNYLLSYLAMAYMPLMTIFTILIFVSIFTLMNVSAVLMKVVIGILALCLAVVLIKYNIEKEKIKKYIRALKYADEYNDAVMLGECFFLEDRMLAYKKAKCKEYKYDELQSLTLANDKKWKAVLTFEDNTYTVPLASEKQGDKLASFLKRKNNSIKLDGFNEIALNQLHDIDASV